MGLVSVDPQILDELSLNISDIQQRTKSNSSETQIKGEQILGQITQEVQLRRRRVEDLTIQYRSCCRDPDADCSELRRRLNAAQQALEQAVRAQKLAVEALTAFNAKSKTVNDHLSKLATAGISTLKKLKNNLDDYTAFSGLTTAGSSGLVQSSQGQEANTGDFGDGRKLSQTSQNHINSVYGNQSVLVFNHPQQSANDAVINQGSANADFQGDCGLCAVGSIMRKAGVGVWENDVVLYASNNGLCLIGKNPAHNGGTSSNQLVEILQGAGGISAHNDIGKSMEDLAASIENGSGVVIGIDPTLVNPNWYGPFVPNSSGGHWVVLESVVRDSKTNEIVGFFIIDSNGSSAKESCQFIETSNLQTAYDSNGAESVITDDIIW